MAIWFEAPEDSHKASRSIHDLNFTTSTADFFFFIFPFFSMLLPPYNVKLLPQCTEIVHFAPFFCWIFVAPNSICSPHTISLAHYLWCHLEHKFAALTPFSTMESSGPQRGASLARFLADSPEFKLLGCWNADCFFLLLLILKKNWETN